MYVLINLTYNNEVELICCHPDRNSLLKYREVKLKLGNYNSRDDNLQVWNVEKLKLSEMDEDEKEIFDSVVVPEEEW